MSVVFKAFRRPVLLAFQPNSKIKMSSCSAEQRPPVESSIILKLTKELEPSHLQVVNESHMHNVPAGSETHFKVFIVSPKFETMKTLLSRHRAVNAVLSDELSKSVHALSIVAKTPKEFELMEMKEIEPSPKCRGGFGK